MADTSDCELRDDWFPQQDVDAWSSLTYDVMASSWWPRSRVAACRGRCSRCLPWAVLAPAMLLVAEGLGSLLYHVDASDLARFLGHDPDGDHQVRRAADDATIRRCR